MWDLEPAHQEVGEAGVEIDLNQNGDRQQDHRDPSGRQVLRLESEDQHEGQEQRADHDRMKLWQETPLKPFRTVRSEEQGACQPSGHQRNHDENHHGRDQYFRRHNHVGNAAQEHHDRREGEQHDQVVDGHLNQGVCRVPIRKVGPYKNHGRTGSGGKDDEAGRVVLCRFRIDPPGKHVLHEKPGQQRHAEGLDQPVDKQGHHQSPGPSRDPRQGAEIHLQHHGVNHQPEKNPDGHVHLGSPAEFKVTEGAGEPGPHSAERHTRHHAEQDPDGEVTLEKIQAFGRGDGLHGGVRF